MWNRKYACALAVALTIAGTMGMAPTGRATSEKKTVEEASTRFYQALNAMFTGEVALMVEVWSHANDVTYMGPGGGMQVGWDQVLASWEAQADMKLGGKIEPIDAQIVVGRNLAIVCCYEQGENTNADGKTEKVSIRATNVFRKERGGWKMISHHTDLLPFLEK